WCKRGFAQRNSLLCYAAGIDVVAGLVMGVRLAVQYLLLLCGLAGFEQIIRILEYACKCRIRVLGYESVGQSLRAVSVRFFSDEIQFIQYLGGILGFGKTFEQLEVRRFRIIFFEQVEVI